MGVTTHQLGVLKDGRAVTCFTLENSSGQQAVVTDLGAAWLCMRTPDCAGRMADVLLGYDSVDMLLHNDGHLGAIVGRNANRIGGGAFQLNGKSYQLAKNNGDNNLHSGPDYLEQRLYQTAEQPERPMESGDAASITFLLKSPDGDQGYPGTLEISVTYTLTEDGAFKISYRLTAGQEATLCNFTNHAYFNLAGHRAGSILGHRLWINADAITEGGADSVPRGNLLSVAGTPFDFRKAKPIGQDIGAPHPELLFAGGYDHNFCLHLEKAEDGQTRLCHAAAVTEPESGRRMDVYTDMPGIQLYTGNFLNPKVQGKEGASYHPRDGFALETQYYPNAINVPGWAQPVIEAEETRRYETIYRFGVEA